jgi:hypothetical protein
VRSNRLREGAWLTEASNQASAARTASSVSSLMKSKNFGASNSYASSIWHTAAAAAEVLVSGAMGRVGAGVLGHGGIEARVLSLSLTGGAGRGSGEVEGGLGMGRRSGWMEDEKNVGGWDGGL